MRKHLWKVLFVVVVVAVLAAALCACGIVDKIKDAHGSDYTPQSSDDPDYVRGCNITVDYQDGSAPFVVNVDLDRTFYIGPSARHGYTFLGYFDEPTGGVQYTDSNGTSLPGMGMVTKSFNLYAHYTPLEFSLRFDAGDGDLLGENKRVLTYASDVSAFPVAQMDNHDFVGWYTADDKMVIDEYGDCVYTTFGGDFAALFGDYKLTLYAHYDIKKYNVTFVLNDGTGESVTVSAPYGSAIADAAPAMEDTDTAVFSGWSSATGGVAQNLGNVMRNTTVYGVWTAFKYVYFYADPADKSPACVKRVLNDGQPAAFPSDDEIIKKGYRVVEWYDNATLSGLPVGSLSYGNAREKYYAKWEETAYTIRYVCASDSYPDDVYYYGDSKDLPTPEREGYAFNGWSEREDLTGTLVRAITPDTYGSKTYYAKFTASTYKITLRKKNGDGDVTVRVKYGDSYTLPVPERIGYDFRGWYDAEEGGLQMAGVGGKSAFPYASAEDSVYYARWTPKSLTVTFVFDNGDEPMTVQTTYGSRIEAPEEPWKEGGFFNGWYDETYRNEFRFDVDVVEADLTLYASWIDSVGISSSDGFLAIAQNPNGNYHLECDVNMKGQAIPAIATFGGQLNGQGYRVYNFSYTGAGTSVGMIGTNNGVIKNIVFDQFSASLQFTGTRNDVSQANLAFLCTTNAGTITGCTLSGATVTIVTSPENAFAIYNNAVTRDINVYVGVLCTFNSGVLDDCHVVESNVTITAKPANKNSQGREYNCRDSRYNVYVYYGAVASVNNAAGEVSRCSAATANALTIGAAGRTDKYTHSCYLELTAGGLLGRNYGTMSQCKADCTVTGTGEYGYAASSRFFLAGMLARNETNATTERCYATGSIAVGGTYDGEWSQVSGFCRRNEPNAMVRDSYSDVTINVTGSMRHVGFVTSNAGTFQNCYSAIDMNVTGTQTSGAGNFLAYCEASSKINNCFAAGTMTMATASSLGYFAGSVTGGALFTNCAYDANMNVTVSGGITQTDPVGVSPMGKARLLATEYLTSDLSFDEAIWIVEDGQLPTLRWMAE